MNRSHILAVVMKHVRANVHLDEGMEIDPSRSLLEQGISSLDAVEITYGAMKELRIRLPVTEMTRLRGIDQLVDLLTDKCGGTS